MFEKIPLFNVLLPSRSLAAPILLFLVAMGYGLLLQQPLPAPPGPPVEVDTPPTSERDPLLTRYRIQPLDEVLALDIWKVPERWTPTPSSSSGLGYLDEPATFMATVRNPSASERHLYLVVSAPFLDQVRLVIPGAEGPRALPTLGDRQPRIARMVEHPALVWPLDLPANSERTLLFEVENAGPTMLPLTVFQAHELISGATLPMLWKTFGYGVVAFALIFNLAIAIALRSVANAWLTCFLVNVIAAQLVIDGLGLWLIWPRWPAINELFVIFVPLGMLALCQFIHLFLGTRGRPAAGLALFSLLGLGLIVLGPLAPRLPIRAVTLPIGLLALVYAFGLALARARQQQSARILALALFALLAGVLIAALRTTGALPINNWTSSGIYLGTAVASAILTTAVAWQLLLERKRRHQAAALAHHERALRSRIESDYDRLLSTHRVTGRPIRGILEETVTTLAQSSPLAVCLVRLRRYGDIERAVGYEEAERLLRVYLDAMEDMLKARFGDDLVRFQEQCLATLDTATQGFVVRLDNGATLDGSAPAAWLQRPFVHQRYSFSWVGELGVTHAPSHGTDGPELIARAGYALLDGAGIINFYDPREADHHDRQRLLMLDLEGALDDGSIYMAYQPKVDVASGEIISFEALIRWRHPEFGFIPPDQWIPYYEQVGAIHRVSLWAAEAVCKDLPALQQRYGNDLSAAVNISGRDLLVDHFDRELLAILAKYRISPGKIILEVTETAVMANVAQARRNIERLGAAGFRVSMDDFGTGNSSLGALASFRLSELKIDRGFLQDITVSPVRQRILQAALELGETLQLQVVMEGVEDEAVAAWLQQFPNLYGQGYYWGHPATLDEWLNR